MTLALHVEAEGLGLATQGLGLLGLKFNCCEIYDFL